MTHPEPTEELEALILSEAISPAIFWLPADERGRRVFGSTSGRIRNEPPLRLVM